uniref:Glycine-rich protein n=1 Tax=Cannabis sativa TaxID=3483 RepID=A0A803QVB5_CANSA
MGSTKAIGVTFLILLLVDLSLAARSLKATKGGGGGGGRSGNGSGYGSGSGYGEGYGSGYGEGDNGDFSP